MFEEKLIQEAELIIFDWDGTLIDSHDYIIDTMLEAAKTSGFECPSRAQVSAIIGMSMEPAIQSLFPALNQQEVLGFRSIYTEHYNDKARKQPVLFAGVRERLERLSVLGKQLAIATGKRRSGLVSGLQDTRSAHFFSELRTADDCASKPAPDMVLSILSAMHIKPESALVVGDNVLDIQMARAAGVAAIGVATGSSTMEAMKQAGAARCYPAFSGID